MEKYKDKNGDVIKVGQRLVHDSGEIETVFECGDSDLGIACNESEAYPLSQFDMREWEIVKEEAEYKAMYG